MKETLFASPVPVASETPDAVLARIEQAGERLSTPCGNGAMVWRRWGSGPPLVLLHGGYGSWRHWIHNIPALASHHTVLVADLPGLGDSDEMPEPVTPDSIAAVIAEGIQGLTGPGTPIDLVGFSFGAMISGHVAALLGPSVRSLTLVAGGALGTARAQTKLAKWNDDMSESEMREVHQTNLALLMIADGAKIDELALLIQQENTRLARLKSRQLSGNDSLAQALRRSVPNRLNAIWGEVDQSAGGTIPERVAILRSIRPDVQIRLIPGAGHWVAYEDPEAFNRTLAELLEAAALPG
ncbi:MAG: alpha/beta hydrolase [Herminiimonas sp.]|nr:alpha/beta hydrolase [Herminiimonas sp.]